jgi:hypothetical protein
MRMRNEGKIGRGSPKIRALKNALENPRGDGGCFNGPLDEGPREGGRTRTRSRRLAPGESDGFPAVARRPGIALT